jgi:primosomal protein N'
MKIGDLVTLRWGEGKRTAGMVVDLHYNGNEWIDEVKIQWLSEWNSTSWVRAADLEIVNENR